MHDYDTILERLRVAVAETLSIEPEEAEPAQRFFADLGAESIDWLDLSFRVERDWKVRLPGLGSFDGIATDAEGRFVSSGMDVLREFMPASLLDRLGSRESLPTAKELAEEITIADIAGMVVLALQAKQTAQAT